MAQRLLIVGLVVAFGLLSSGCGDKKEGGEANVKVVDGIPKDKELSRKTPAGGKAGPAGAAD